MTRTTWMVLASSLALLTALGCSTQSPPPLGHLVMPPLELETLPRPTVRRGLPGETQPAHDKAWLAENPRPWKFIVIHHSATDGGNAAAFDKAHRGRGWDELGYHFVITNGQGATDGTVEVGSRWAKQKHGAHTGGTPDNEYNELGIGICLVGDFSTSPPSKAQLAALARLSAWLQWRFRIPAENVIGHCEAPAAHTNCPGSVLLDHVRKRHRPAPEAITATPAAGEKGS